MLMGEFFPKLDEKHRIVLPAKFRGEFNDGLVLTKGQDRCIYAYTRTDFEDLYQRIRQAPSSSRDARNYARMFLSAASDETPDKQFRVTIPQSLRDYAGLERDLAVIGVGSHVEVWDAAQWQQFVTDQEDGYSALEEEVIPGML